MEKKEKPNLQFNRKLRQFTPAIGLVVITLGLMFFFKQKKENLDDFIQQGKENLADFYTQNLRPILFKTDLTNEDVFNFALHQNLPIDKEENKVLQIGVDEPTGNEYFEIKPAVVKENTNNYEKFSSYLDLDKYEHEMLDSILNSYKNDLYTAVLYNEHNTIAVNPKLSLIRDAILADLMAFAQNSKTVSGGADILPVNYTYNTPEIRKTIKEIREAKEKEVSDYIMFTPDSVFERECEFDKDKFAEEIALVKENIGKLEPDHFRIKVNVASEIDNSLPEQIIESNFKINIDSSYYKAVVPRELIAKRVKNVQRVEYLKENIEELTSRINNLSVEFNSKLGRDINLKIQSDEQIKDMSNWNFEINIQNIDSFVNKTVSSFTDEDFGDWEEFGFKMDSLANSFHLYYKDSSSSFDKRKFKEEMKKAKREFKKLKESERN